MGFAEQRLIGTPVGDARVTVHRPPVGGRGALVLGHGAGGSGPTADLAALTGLAERGWTVVLVDQPWRVAGRRVAGPPAQLDAAWLAVWRELATTGLPRPHVGGGRSSGARVVARTAETLNAETLNPDGLLLLSFPLAPPRANGGTGPSRASELAAGTALGCPVLAVQGRRDPYGSPEDLARALPSGPPGCLTIEGVAGTHTLTRAAGVVTGIVGSWLDAQFPPLPGERSGEG